ncbi:MAG TPA: 2-oxoacid:acceptor oxidoreductase family protein [Planctomycetota bacterium]|nr:2-oxoacid:acceptor oxidoreductase family protein [Planctomycetota bacterium]
MKTAATMAAEVALEEGKFAQGFPEYGPERMGAPVQGYTRISDNVITIHCGVANPDVVMVLDNSLVGQIDVTAGLADDGILVINTPESPAEIRKRLGLKGMKLYTVDATQISIDELGRSIPNTPMMGALVKITALLTMDTLKKDVQKKFMKKFGDRIVQGNFRSLERAYREVKSE